MGAVLPLRKVLESAVEVFIDDPSFRSRILGALLCLVLVVGAFASGLEVRISIGRSASPVAAPGGGVDGPPDSEPQPERAIAAVNGLVVPAAPGADGAAPGLVRGGEPPVPTVVDGDAATRGGGGPLGGADTQRASAPGVEPEPGPGWEDESGEGEPRCVVTETLVLEELESVQLETAEEVCDDATRALDELQPGARSARAWGAGALVLLVWWV